MQPCFCYHSVITYISDYWSKDDTGLIDVINSVLKQAISQSLKEQMKLIANTFMTHRQIGEAEATFRLLPNMLLKNSNVACQWISVGKRSEMTKRWKLASKEEVENSNGLIQIKDREGYWIEQSDMISKYLRRPNEVELISASQFAKMYTTSGMNHKADDTFEEGIDDNFDERSEDSITKKCDLNFIITGNDDLIKLPEFIRLLNSAPREPKMMRKRKKPAALRYHKVSHDNQYEKWMLKELMLYTPFRLDDLDAYENNSAHMYLEKREWILKVKSQVMEHLESVEEARYMVEQSMEDSKLEEIGASIDAAYEQDKVDGALEGNSDHPDYLHLDTDGLTLADNEQPSSSIFKDINVPDMKQLRKDTQKLDEYQMEVLSVAITYAKDIVKSKREGNVAPKPIYIIGHGGAGSGKSTVIDLVAKWCHSILIKEGDDVSCPYIIKTAFTGTAASNIDGQTLHTAFSFNFDNKFYSLSDKKRDEKRALFKNLKIIVIDEVSMVKADMLYQLDLKLQEVKEKVGIPFGGVSILAFGDMLQLRPVLGAFPFEKPKNPEFSAAFELQNRWKMFQIINLEVNQ